MLPIHVLIFWLMVENHNLEFIKLKKAIDLPFQFTVIKSLTEVVGLYSYLILTTHTKTIKLMLPLCQLTPLTEDHIWHWDNWDLNLKMSQNLDSSAHLIITQKNPDMFISNPRTLIFSKLPLQEINNLLRLNHSNLRIAH